MGPAAARQRRIDEPLADERAGQPRYRPGELIGQRQRELLAGKIDSDGRVEAGSRQSIAAHRLADDGLGAHHELDVQAVTGGDRGELCGEDGVAERSVAVAGLRVDLQAYRRVVLEPREQRFAGRELAGDKGMAESDLGALGARLERFHVHRRHDRAVGQRIDTAATSAAAATAIAAAASGRHARAGAGRRRARHRIAAARKQDNGEREDRHFQRTTHRIHPQKGLCAVQAGPLGDPPMMSTPWVAAIEASPATVPIPSSKWNKPTVAASGTNGAVGGVNPVG